MSTRLVALSIGPIHQREGSREPCTDVAEGPRPPPEQLGGRFELRVVDSEGVADDRIEQASNAFFERVRQGFLSIAREELDRFLTVDGTDTIDAVASVIADEVNSRLEAVRS